MDQRTNAIFAKALDGLSMRAMATAQNIANANSETYRPVRVEFEQALKVAAAGGPVALNDFRPEVVADTSEVKSGQQRIDLELTTASETALRYSALIDVISREMSLQRTMIRGGQ